MSWIALTPDLKEKAHRVDVYRATHKKASGSHQEDPQWVKDITEEIYAFYSSVDLPKGAM